MKVKLSDHFTYGRLFRFTAPTAIMTVFISVYGIVDGLFVSNFAGKEPFAALNLIYPMIMMLGALGFMMGTGGNALLAKTMGEGKRERANRLFSFFVLVTVGAGVVFAVIGVALVRPVAVMLGATDSLLELSVLYGTILTASLPFLMLQYAFQSYLTAAGKPQVGLAISVAAGVVNMVLDALFIAGFGWGLVGAAWATVIGEVVAAVTPVIYFALSKTSMLSFARPLVDMRALGKACVNGLSELVSNLAMSLVAMVYNYQLMRLLGADGVAAYGVVQYVAWIFTALLMGYSMGVSPVVSYHYGAKNQDELKNLFRKSLVVIAITGFALLGIAQVFATPLARLFVGYDADVTALTVTALSIYMIALPLSGYNMFGSALFTALNNGLVSAIISFVRTLVFEVGAVLLLPAIIGANGIWFAIIVAEGASFVLTTVFVVALHKHYGYA